METGYTYVIGMDMGTTNIKAIALRSDGTVCAEAALPSTHYNPGPAMQEQDAEEWWDHVCVILKAVAEQLGAEEVNKIRGNLHQFPYGLDAAGDGGWYSAPQGTDGSGCAFLRGDG